MNLKSLTDDLFARLDWDPTPTARAVSIAHTFINRALAQVVLDAPFLFYEDRFVLRTQPDVVPTLASDTLSIEQADVPGAIDNPWVMNVTLVPGSTSGQVAFPTDRRWDGRMLEVTDLNGVKRLTRIRSIYRRTVSGTNRISITMWNPWNPSDWGRGPFTDWRIYTPSYSLPDDVIEVKSLRVVHDGKPYPIPFLSHPDAEDLGLSEHSDTQAGGTPSVAFRSGYFRMDGPKVAPVASVVGEDYWLGPEPAGQFEYIVTYTWGKRQFDWANPGIGKWSSGAVEWSDTAVMGTSGALAANNRYAEPMWESSPSPASNQITVAIEAGGVGGKAVRLTIPNIEYALGFMLDVDNGAAVERKSVAHSGWMVRVYRRRLTEDFTNYSTLPSFSGQYVPSLSRMDFDDNHYLMAEFKIDDTNEGVWVDDGSVLPDMERPLRNINGYEQIRFSPQPTAETLIEGRAIRQPAKLISEYDAPHVKDNASDLIVERALVYMYERLGDDGRANNAERRYNDMLGKVRRRYGDGVPGSQVLRRRPSRFPLHSVSPRWRR